jgi:hypothetical protein
MALPLRLSPRDRGLGSPAVSASSRPSRRFLAILVLICLLGAIVRVVYVLAAKQRTSPCSAPSVERNAIQGTTGSTIFFIGKAPENICGDALVYHEGANLLAKGEGFIAPVRFTYGVDLRAENGVIVTTPASDNGGARFQSADHPPLYIVYLAGFSSLGMRSVLAHQLASVLLGIGSIFVIGIVGRRIAGDTVGLIAAGLGAAYIYIWINDGLVMSESIAILFTALTLDFSYRFLKKPSRRNLIWLGIIIGLTVLTRAELLLYVPLVVPYLAWQVSKNWKKAALNTLAIGALAAVVISPWVIRNLVTFEKPVTLSTGAGITLAYANCDTTYSGQFLGYWSFQCLPPNVSEPDQSLDEVIFRRQGIDYMKDHLSQVPKVVAARVLRQWNLFRPWQMTDLDTSDNRELTLNRIGLFEYYALMALAVPGAFLLRKRGEKLWPLLSMYIVVTITAISSYGATRLRTPAEVSTVLLAAVAIHAIARWATRRQSSSDGTTPEVGVASRRSETPEDARPV